MMNYFLTKIERIKTWWSNKHNCFHYSKTKTFLYKTINKLAIFFYNLAGCFVRLIIIGIILNIISSHFYPEFPKRFPIIYGFFDGWLQFGEFVFKTALSGIYSFFTGNWNEHYVEYKEAFQALLQEAINWFSNIHF